MSILKQKKDYSRYYGNFRGVDFSSDHTQVADTRLAYAVNMYKDYQSSQGQAIETIAGYRRMFEAPNKEEVYAIHYYEVDKKPQILVHAGDKLYSWANYPHTVNTELTDTFSAAESGESVGEITFYTVDMGAHVSEIKRVIRSNGEDITQNSSYSNGILTIARSDMMNAEAVTVTYIEGKATAPIYSGMQRRVSVSVIMNNLLYIIDGEHYLVYDGETIKNVEDVAYIPTTYINIIPSGSNADAGTEYEQRNMLQPRFKHTFIADGVNTTFNLNEQDIEGIDKVSVYGETLDPTTYKVDLAKGSVVLFEPPKKPEEITRGDADGATYPEFYAGVEITARKTIKNISGITSNEESSGIITGCRIACVFDNRLFLSGNPKYPNHIFWCGRNDTGYVDPTYFGQLNYAQDGVGVSEITGMIPVADTLMVLKSDSIQDGTVFFHTPTGTESDILTRTYPSEQGLNGTGCLGACVNFLDDPIFISKLGVEAVGQLSVRYERATEHRSNTIDATLTNLDLSKARLEEWNGYLVLLVEGKIFLADSRQRFADEMGNYQYEWYYLEDIGVYKEQYLKYLYSKSAREDVLAAGIRYCTECGHSESECVCGEDTHLIWMPLELAKDVYNVNTGTASDLLGSVANEADDNGHTTKYIHSELITTDNGDLTVYFTVEKDYDRVTNEEIGYRAFICGTNDEQIGGVFSPAVSVRAFDGNIFFGTKNGVVCGFNFDKRDEYGDIDTKWYSFDGRVIRCGAATKMDHCGIPHLTKTTVKKSTVIKTKNMQASAAKIKVRTNRKEYAQIARISSSIFSFANIDFDELSFTLSEQSLFAVKEKEKKWVEKQYFVYSDEFQKPFALFYIAYRYTIAGRYKE